MAFSNRIEDLQILTAIFCYEPKKICTLAIFRDKLFPVSQLNSLNSGTLEARGNWQNKVFAVGLNDKLTIVDYGFKRKEPVASNSSKKKSSDILMSFFKNLN